MITNIIDHREKPYRWKTVNVIIENTWQDNGSKDADQASALSEHQVTYDEKRGVSISEAMAWGMSVKADVTLYIYDEGKGF